MAMKRKALGKTSASGSRAKRAGALKAKATTVRIEPRLQRGLELVQKIEKKPINKLINQAIAEMVDGMTAKIEGRLDDLLAQIKAYRRKDPNFDAAIAAFVDAEAKLAGDDPAEGSVERRSGKAGPAQAMVRELLAR